MCLAVPGEVLEVGEEEMAVVRMGGVRRNVSLSLVEGVDAGDFVLVHAGFAIEKIDEAEAKKTMELFEELARLDEIP